MEDPVVGQRLISREAEVVERARLGKEALGVEHQLVVVEDEAQPRRGHREDERESQRDPQ